MAFSNHDNPVGNLLLSDHVAIGDVLRELLAALNLVDRKTTFDKLDLLWTRFETHNLAEERILFPAIINALRSDSPRGDCGFSLVDAQHMIAALRSDHLAFMRMFPRALDMARAILDIPEGEPVGIAFMELRRFIGTITELLVSHDRFEEQNLYRWASLLLDDSAQRLLASRMQVAIRDLPPRFSESIAD